MTEIYFDGGLFMYPILLVFMVGMAIMIERWFLVNRFRSVNRKMPDEKGGTGKEGVNCANKS